MFKIDRNFSHLSIHVWRWEIRIYSVSRWELVRWP
jgi:hypothetical protein